jgi:hypothetical protein
MLRFQYGQNDAIEAVARNRASLFTGLVLVLLTGIPRNYDQTWLLESPFWLVGPLIFSFFSGSFLFLILYFGFIRRHLEAPKPKQAQWRCFISLFWMTAPVAWLYAIPVERFMTSYHAAQANLALLAIVSLWRVLLMARIISVMQKTPFLRALGWVLVPACLEVLLVVILTALFGGDFSRQIMAAMSGMRNAPEKVLMTAALNNVFTTALILLPIVLILLAVFRFRKTVPPFPEAGEGQMPVRTLCLLAAIWIAIAVPAQIEQYRFVTHAKLIETGKYRQSVDYLSHYTRKDFPASRRIEPNPYEYQVWEQLPNIMAVLQPSDPEWIRRLYLEHMDVMFSHYGLECGPSELVQMFAALERLPEGKDWIERNYSELSKINMAMMVRMGNEPDRKSTPAAQQLTNVLQRLGVDLSTLKQPEHP